MCDAIGDTFNFSFKEVTAAAVAAAATTTTENIQQCNFIFFK